MHVNSETFYKILKQRGMTQTAVAHRAGVGLKTVGRIKRGQNLRLSRVEKIAEALKTTVEALVNPPVEDKKKNKRGDLKRLVADLDGHTLNNLMLASIHYKVSINTLIMYAPLLFSIVAELSLKRRKDEIDDWFDSALQAIKKSPRYDAENPEYRALENDLSGIHEEELHSIEQRELAGNSDGTDYYTELPYGETWVENLFLQYLEYLGKEANQDLMFYGSSTDEISFHSSALADAETKMYGGEEEFLAEEATPDYVLLRDIPKGLLAENLIEERTLWLASHYGGAKGDIERARKIRASDRSYLAEENKNE